MRTTLAAIVGSALLTLSSTASAGAPPGPTPPGPAAAVPAPAKAPVAKGKAKKVLPVVATVTTDAPVLRVESTSARPLKDYEAEVQSGIPLDDPYAKERGLEKGLVRMFFERERRRTYRIHRDRIKSVARFVVVDAPKTESVKFVRVPQRHAGAIDKAGAPVMVDRIDVLELTDGSTVAVETTHSNAGMFTSSEVYVFAKKSTLEQRLAAVDAAAPSSRGRLRQALLMAAGESAVHPAPAAPAARR